MDVKEAAKLAKDYVADLFRDEGISNVGLEEIELHGQTWEVTVGFSRPWDQGGLATVTLGQKGAPSRSLESTTGCALSHRSEIASYRTPSETRPLEGYFLDANLFVLLVVGSESPGLAPMTERATIQSDVKSEI